MLKVEVMDISKKWHVVRVARSIKLISSYGPLKKSKVARKSRKLIVLLPWLMAKKRNVEKLIQFYISLGFDVLCGAVSVSELLFPTVGAQVCSHYIICSQKVYTIYSF